MAEDAVAEHEDVGNDEGGEDRRQHQDGFVDAPDVQDHQQHDQHRGRRNLEPGELRRKVAEQGIDARGDGNGDRQDVVDDQRGAGNDARSFPEHVGGHDVAAAPVREMLNDPRVGVGDDADREGRGQGEKQGQVRVAAQGPEGLFRTVRGGRKPIRAQPDPRQQWDERQLVKDVRIVKVSRGTEQPSGDPLPKRRFVHGT